MTNLLHFLSSTADLGLSTINRKHGSVQWQTMFESRLSIMATACSPVLLFLISIILYFHHWLLSRMEIVHFLRELPLLFVNGLRQTRHAVNQSVPFEPYRKSKQGAPHVASDHLTRSCQYYFWPCCPQLSGTMTRMRLCDSCRPR